MSTTASSVFTGASRYSSDFQQVIARAVAIASLPLNQLTAEKTSLQSQSSALTTLDEKFTAVQSAMTALGTATGLSSYSTSMSNGGIVSAALSEGAHEGTYNIEVLDLGARTNASSTSGVADPSSESISSAGSFTLTVGSTTATVQPAANTLDDLVAAINDSGLDAQASLVNFGTNEAPEYHVSLFTTRYDNLAVKLEEGATNLMAAPSAGAQASYKLNGTQLASDSRSILAAPGLMLTLLADSQAGVATTVTVARSANAVSAALALFVSAYNAAVQELDRSRGREAGALAGGSMAPMLAQALRRIAHYSAPSGSIASLTDLGLNFDDHGLLSFDSAKFAEATAGQEDELMAFLGSSTGSGFLKASSDILKGLLDTNDGSIKTTEEALAAQIASQDGLIAAKQDQIDYYQKALVEQMSAADALIAALEQQVTYMTNLFESMRIANEMYAR